MFSYAKSSVQLYSSLRSYCILSVMPKPCHITSISQKIPSSLKIRTVNLEYQILIKYAVATHCCFYLHVFFHMKSVLVCENQNPKQEVLKDRRRWQTDPRISQFDPWTKRCVSGSNKKNFCTIIQEGDYFQVSETCEGCSKFECVARLQRSQIPKT